MVMNLTGRNTPCLVPRQGIIECGAWRITGEDFVNGLRRKTPKFCGTTRLGRWKVNLVTKQSQDQRPGCMFACVCTRALVVGSRELALHCMSLNGAQQRDSLTLFSLFSSSRTPQWQSSLIRP
ncbi:Potassium transporter 5 [Fusarium oxysporum f. sp. albedinis]|nr:Potassium transporter 5 [Fusarium oxysporum f. sp. albedinis]